MRREDRRGRARGGVRLSHARHRRRPGRPGPASGAASPGRTASRPSIRSNPEADYRELETCRSDSYDAALCCIPDEPKIQLLRYLLGNGKHVLVEKPLWARRDEDIDELQALRARTGAVCYTAYNHRFEPHFVRMRDLIASGELGTIYSCRMFYGNGTARLVRDSAWRDEGAGVLPDLGSHLLDTCRFWFGDLRRRFRVSAANAFENRAPDHVVIANEHCRPRIELEMTLLMWRNHFTCDVLAEKRHGAHHVAVQVGSVVPSSTAARAAERPTARGDRSRWCRMIRPGRLSTRTSSRCARAARRPICRPICGSTATLQPPWRSRGVLRMERKAA